MGLWYLAFNLRDVRLALGLSQTALALSADPKFSQVYISRLERGLWPSDMRHVEILARALGVPPRRLLQRPRHPRRMVTFPLRDTQTPPPAPARPPRAVDPDPLEAA